MNSIAVKIVAMAGAALLAVGGIGVLLWSSSSATHAARVYHEKRQALDASLKTASQQGYTASDLEPVTSELRGMDGSAEPWWLPGRPGYFERLTSRTVELQGQLRALEQLILDSSRSDSARQVDAARAGIGQAQQANAADPDVQALRQRLEAAARAQGAAHTVRDYRAASQQAQTLARDASAVYEQVQQENQQIQAAAQALVAQAGGNLAAIQQAGAQAVANGHNDATIAAYMNRPSPFKGYDQVSRFSSRLDKFAAMVGSGDVNQAAQGTAGVQRYAGMLHDALISGLPAKAVIVSFQAQRLYAFENGKVVLDTLVTTGVRGVSDIGTDFGAMKVLRKSHPWKMHSPWPKGSPYWYPDTDVQWTTFFTNTGEAIHDASWEPDSLLGPGSQYDPSTRSHGCIHVAYDKAEWMFNWAPIGMPVVVFPGDGAAAANQLSLITTDDQGNPKGIA